MKKFLFISLLLILITSSVQSQNNVAIYTTTCYEEYLRDWAETAMVNKFNDLDQYRLIERNKEFLKKVHHELDYQLDGNIDPKQIAAIGKQFGAQYVVIIQIHNKYLYAAKMINVETAQIVVSASSNDYDKVAKLLTGEIKYKNFKVNKVVEKGPIRYVSDFRSEVLEQKDNNLTMITDLGLLEYLLIKYPDRFGREILTSYSVTKRPASIRSQTLVRYTVNLVYLYDSYSRSLSKSSYSEEVVYRASGNVVKCYDNVKFLYSFKVLYYPSNLYEW